MRLPPFEMHKPDSLEEAIGLLEGLGDSAALYCGGTELLLVMRMGLTDLDHLVDLKGLDGLRSITLVDGMLRIGAAVTHREIENHPLVTEHAPELASMIGRIANVRVRSVGTLGGNLAFADPASDPATFLTAVNAQVGIRGPSGCRRTLSVEDLSISAYQTALEDGEVIEAVLVQPTEHGVATVHERLKFQERPAIVVTVSTRASGGSISESRIAVGAVSPTPTRFRDAETLLHGVETHEVMEAATRVGDAIAETVELLDDDTSGVAYKRQLTRVLVARTATRAMDLSLTI
ncbi:MAG: xanthine dehydrogenase family protein subunit M [Gemmatimonadales bacterium]|jgi:carbon-monoxide dehydrogenase medium subunit|nr:xanthine dehydrogenase family protein subunit M [Gemmatimonadales bacterium]MBT4188054.1 xanthine dehydrogenase family protein subunit M [Gemmatimonadales bacterium]MBT6374386.1 xanthine dehydrogenase family protein subunit M [Gemmatimonadales bacterium]MBT7692053.1 xanthine dehydrogenase family protein subunit M [Gemmatimonadales bacterium]|tara:strand:+ start:2243 stop:3115 length:873 start_codon:yes stop_codon:yes gene_type:complete